MIAQTLHGYDQGHRLLARGGEVNEAELSILDRLSDLSGYVPLGTEFDRYHTGFPCGRYYAFACTWPDKGAPRAGTVLTHTLLVPVVVVESARDPWSFGSLHRKPAAASDREPYQVALPVIDEAAAEAPPVPAEPRALAAITLWFGQAERPVLWVEEARPDDVVRYLWGLLWPEARRQFSFCTFALQVRTLRREPFGFLALPPSARGSFHERARSAAWWQEGALGSATLRRRLEQGWVREVFERGGEVTRAMRQFCVEQTLPVPETAQLPVYLRFAELGAGAVDRLTAARARADLLDRLWPGLPAEHPLVRATLTALLARQADAPLAPRPFWELADLLGRPAVRALSDADVSFADSLTATVAREVRLRIEQAAPETLAGISSLLAPDSAPPGVLAAALAAVSASIRALSEAEEIVARARVLLLAADGVLSLRLAEVVLAALSPPRRVQTALAALAEVALNARPGLVDALLTAAHRIEALLLIVEVWIAEGQPLRGLQDAAVRVLEGSPVEPARLGPALARVSPETRLAWALEVSAPALAVWSGERGAEAARELAVPVQVILERCSTAPNGAQVLLPYLIGFPVEALRDEDLLSPAVRSTLAAEAAASPDGERLAIEVARRLTQQSARGLLEREIAPAWFSLPRVQRAFAAEGAGLFTAIEVRLWDRACLPNLTGAVASYVRHQPAQATLFWVPGLLSRPLDEATSESLARAVDALATILGLPADREGWEPLAAAALTAVRRTGCPAAYPLVERVFPVLYGRLVRNALSPAARAYLGRYPWYEWDLARSWRHWLLDTWIDQRWPLPAFLRSFGEDEALFSRVAHRAAKKSRKRELLFALEGVLRSDRDLAKRWAGPLARVLRDTE